MKLLHSISAKIFFIFLALVIVLFVAVTPLYSRFAYNSLVEQARINDLKLIDTIRTALCAEQEKVRISGAALQHDAALLSYMREATETARENKSLYLSMDSTLQTNRFLSQVASSYITLVDADGFLIGEQQLERENLYNFLGKSAIRNFSHTEATMCKLYRVRDVHTGVRRNVFPYVFPLEREGTLLGYAVLYLDEATLQEVYAAYGDEISVLDSDNVILSNKDNTLLFQNYYSHKKINYAFLMRDTTTVAQSAGDDWIVTTRTINELGWQIVIAKSMQQVLAESNYNFRYLSAVSCIVGVLAAFITLLISLFLTHPIVKLNASVEKVKLGDLSARSEIHSRDEIGQLSVSFNEMLDTINTLLEQTAENERAQHRAQMQLVQAQLKPHFLYNVLGIISGFMNDGEKQLGNTAIDSLAMFYRISLSDGSDVIPLRKEIELIENYLTLQQLRYVDVIDYEIDVDDALLEIAVPKFTLQPLVENAIYHGIREKPGGGFIQIKGQTDGDFCLLTVRDNGLGMNSITLNSLRRAILQPNIKEHFGLSSIYKRLDYYSGHRANMTLDSRESSYTLVSLRFPATPQNRD